MIQFSISSNMLLIPSSVFFTFGIVLLISNWFFLVVSMSFYYVYYFLVSVLTEFTYSSLVL